MIVRRLRGAAIVRIAVKLGIFCQQRLEHHALPVFTRKNGGYPLNRHHNFAHTPCETCLKTNGIIAQTHAARGIVADIEHYLIVLHILARHGHRGIYPHQNVRREAVVSHPFMPGTNQIGLGGSQRWCKGRHGEARQKWAAKMQAQSSDQCYQRRMTFSDGVSASI